MMVIAKLLLVVLVLWAGSSTVTSTMYHHNTMRKFGGKFVCDKYRLPRNAVWTPRTNCEGSKRFKCQPGYESRVQTRCEKGVVSLEPTCHVPALVKCLSGEKIANSENVTQSRMVGEDFEFSCQSEFTENGTTGVLTCGENGNWTIKEPCKVCYMPGKRLNISLPQIYVNYDPHDCDSYCDLDDGCGFSIFVDNCYFYNKPISFFAQDMSIFECTEKCKELTECLTVSFSGAGCTIFNATFEILKEQFTVEDVDLRFGYFIREKSCLE